MKSIKQINNEPKKEYKIKPLTVNISGAMFKSLWLEFAKKYEDNYVIDKDNKEVINQLYYYITQNPTCEYDLNKGVMLVGAIGSGKSTAIRVFSDIIFHCNKKIIAFEPAIHLQEIIKNNKLDYYYKRPMIIDDIGKEEVNIKVFGTTRQPMIDLISHRYDNKALTFGTANNTLENLTKKYGEYIGDRFKEMFNIIVLPGQSRRV